MAVDGFQSSQCIIIHQYLAVLDANLLFLANNAGQVCQSFLAFESCILDYAYLELMIIRLHEETLVAYQHQHLMRSGPTTVQMLNLHWAHPSRHSSEWWK